jgi:hypothetical protein
LLTIVQPTVTSVFQAIYAVAASPWLSRALSLSGGPRTLKRPWPSTRNKVAGSHASTGLRSAPTSSVAVHGEQGRRLAREHRTSFRSNVVSDRLRGTRSQARTRAPDFVPLRRGQWASTRNKVVGSHAHASPRLRSALASSVAVHAEQGRRLAREHRTSFRSNVVSARPHSHPSLRLRSAPTSSVTAHAEQGRRLAREPTTSFRPNVVSGRPRGTRSQARARAPDFVPLQRRQ